MTEFDRFAELQRLEEAARSAFGDGAPPIDVEEFVLEGRTVPELEDAVAGR